MSKGFFMSWLALLLVLGLTLPAVAEQSESSQQQPPGSIVLEAERQEQVADGHVLAEGYVDIQYGDVRLIADSVEFWNEEKRVVAVGNVVFQQGDQKIVLRPGDFLNRFSIGGCPHDIHLQAFLQPCDDQVGHGGTVFNNKEFPDS